ncbi:hypothetical protein V865_007783 [Kwoniella europaea PYCC6329]|uniref:Uncharacterized protein n=1 Tax=Kwoniella europaea PYCC6329 TaxID=1423913 RepID=A0AAX4KVQ6_9TREE
MSSEDISYNDDQYQTLEASTDDGRRYRLVVDMIRGEIVEGSYDFAGSIEGYSKSSISFGSNTSNLTRMVPLNDLSQDHIDKLSTFVRASTKQAIDMTLNQPGRGMTELRQENGDLKSQVSSWRKIGIANAMMASSVALLGMYNLNYYKQVKEELSELKSKQNQCNNDNHQSVAIQSTQGKKSEDGDTGTIIRVDLAATCPGEKAEDDHEICTWLAFLPREQEEDINA